MTIPLSKRLQVCAGLVSPGDRVADIGCDHGYLGIFLLKSGLASSVIAADINEMPLQSAKRNAVRFGVSENIQFCLSDGAKKIPKEFDTMICAGMGADTMISILDNAPWLQCKDYRLILQCQSKIQTLRKYLSNKGWRITEESVLRDGRFLYTVMEVIWQPDYPKLTAGESYFPPALLENPGEELPAYYSQVIFKLERAVNGQGAKADPEMVLALSELKELGNNDCLTWLKGETT